MIDQSTDLLSLPLPHPNNRLDEDVVRLRSALALIDELLANRAGLGPDGKLLPSQIPDMVITDYLGTVNSQASMLQLTGQKGDWCIRTDEARVWVVTGPSAASIGSWTALAYPNTSGVTSINSRTGVVTLTKADLGLGNVDDTSDLSKPISTAVANALAGKQATITGAASSVVETLLTAGRVVVSDGFGRIAVSSITADILSYLSGATGNLQNQLGLRVSKTSNTGSAALPVGTTSQRDIAPVTGSIRYNTTTGQFEGYYASSWRTIGDTVSLSSISDWPADVGATEVGYLDGVTSSIQTQLSSLSSSISTLSSGKQAADADLTAIAALSGSYGYLKKTAEGVWTIDAGTGSGGGDGTVTSVSLSAPTNLFTVSGSPVTTAGTLAMTLVTQSANQVFAGPTSGGAAAPGFRALVAADIPSLSGIYQPLNSVLTSVSSSSIAAGKVLASPAGSTGAASFRTLSGSDFGSQSNNYVLAAAAASGGNPNPSFRLLVAADIPNLSSIYQPTNTKLTSLSNLASTGTLSWNGTSIVASANGSFGDLAYTGTLTGGTGVLNIGSGQVYKDSFGNVSLGNNTPLVKFNVNQGSPTRGILALMNNSTVSSSTGALIHYAVSGIADWCAGQAPNENAFVFFHGRNKNADGAPVVKFFYDGKMQSMFLSGTGNRAVYSDASGNLTNSSSDAALKTDIETLAGGLDRVLQMRPITFSWKDTERFGDQRELGFLAQEVQPLAPWVIGENSDGTLSLDYPKLTALLTSAVQELTARVRALESTLNQ